MSATYKGVGGVDGMGGGLRLLSDTMGPVAVKELSMVSKPLYKAKQAFR